MKSLSEYAGSPEKWLQFLTTWMDRKGMVYVINQTCDMNTYVKAFPLEAPPSFVHFYAAMERLNWPSLFKTESDDDAGESLITFRAPRDIKSYIESCDDVQDFIGDGSIEDIEENPKEFQDKNYRTYSRDQEDMSPYVPSVNYRASLLVGLCDYDLCKSRILLNPFVRFDDREWEIVMFNWAPYDVRFSNFADLATWFYLTDTAPGYLESLSVNSVYMDHKDDESRVSRILFSD